MIDSSAYGANRTSNNPGLNAWTFMWRQSCGTVSNTSLSHVNKSFYTLDALHCVAVWTWPHAEHLVFN